VKGKTPSSLAEFNRNIVGKIEVISEYRGEEIEQESCEKFLGDEL